MATGETVHAIGSIVRGGPEMLRFRAGGAMRRSGPDEGKECWAGIAETDVDTGTGPALDPTTDCRRRFASEHLVGELFLVAPGACRA